MRKPSPAIVTQSAVRRLPRMALLMLCLAYILPGFVGREPWRSADITGFGYMWEMAKGTASWLSPQLLAYPEQPDALLPYWLGAGAIQLFSPWLAPDAAARLPFVALLALVLLASWYAVYGLARTPQAQPVMFAFGGEARPADYARAMADGGLLALLACLGLALLSHETAAASAQLAFVALSFFAVVHLWRGKALAGPALAVGLVGLALCGAPSFAVLLGLGSTVIVGLSAPARAGSLPSPSPSHAPNPAPTHTAVGWPAALTLLVCTLAAAGVAHGLDLWRWRLQSLPSDVQQLKGMGRLLLWFGWPATPLAIWTLWRWRQLWRSPHLAIPLWFLVVALGTTLLTASADRSLLLGLPALAALAAFALPTLSRTVTALIDWFTLLFFSGWALVVWVVWLSMQTGIPAKPAANVARLAPGFVPSFSPLALGVATVASLAWIALVRWRVGRHRAAIWKSLVLPAGGATLGWLLVMTLLLPPLDYALNNKRLVQQITQVTGRASGCIEVHGLSPGLVTALRYDGKTHLETRDMGCPWLLFVENIDRMEPGVDTLHWDSQGPPVAGPRGGESVQIYRRVRAGAPTPQAR